jgi:hypothetical protein
MNNQYRCHFKKCEKKIREIFANQLSGFRNEQTHLRVALGDSDFCEKIDPRGKTQWDFEKTFDYTRSTAAGSGTRKT